VDTAARLNSALAGRYEIVREAGAGGMATVFVARDLKHDREVAIKVLKPDLAANLGSERFLQEVRIAAKLQHPHILPVFDSGDADGMLWYAMPFVEGMSLRDRLRQGQMSVAETIRIMREVAGALGKAHESGIVHRDIKPENILLSAGHALVADFGIAKAVSSAASASTTGLTSAGMSLGTPGYMAPEQVAADPNADHRVDIYALGIVTWEMLVGKAPFADLPPAQQLAAHVTTMPDLVGVRAKGGCPPAFDAIIRRCLAKVPSERYAKAGELIAALDAISDPSGPHIPVAITGKPRNPARIAGTVVGIASIALALYLGIKELGNKRAAETAGPSLAVLPFENVQGDSATTYFSDGITEEIIGTVSKLPSLHVISRSVSFRHRGKDIDVKQVGAALGVTHLLEGSVQQVARRVRVSVRLTDVRTGFNAWSERYDRELTDIFAVEDEIASKVAGALNVTLVARSGAGATAHPEAHDAYLLGLSARNSRDLRTAAAQFAKAIALDANYAAAHAALASVLILYPEYGLASPDSAVRAARASAARALALDSSQVNAYLALGYAAKVHGRDFAGAERAYKQALSLNPNSPEGHHWYGELLMERARFAEAHAEFRESVRRDSLAPASVAMLAMSMFRIGRTTNQSAMVDSAEAICRRVTEISPSGGVFPFEFGCGFTLVHNKRYAPARPHLARAGRALGDSTLFVTMLDGVADPAKRAAVVASIDRNAKLDPAIAALWYMLLSEPKKSVASLERAERNGSPYGAFLEVLDFSALPKTPELEAVRKKLGY
jgi:serine/threonine protein kinase/Tfp pilus assembly protein PilF